MEEPVVGKNIDSWCTKCKLMLAHTIEVVTDGKIKKVHCNTCNAQHAYRANPPGTAKKRASSGGGRKKKDSVPAVDYQAMLRDRDPASARPYAMSDQFQPKDLIKHPTFGLGLVVAVRDANKIDVAFNEGMKTLVQKRG